MESSFIKKTLSLIVILGLGMLLGNAILAAIIYMTDGTYPIDIKNLMTDPTNIPMIKAAIGASHFFTFTVSSFIFVKLILVSSVTHYFNIKRFNLEYLFYFIVLLMFAYPLVAASVYLIQLLDLPEWAINIDNKSLEMLSSILYMDNFLSFIGNLIIVAILPAVGEELLFRGIIQKELSKKLKSPILAIFLTSIIFSAFHLQLVGFLPKLIIGLVLGYSYYISKSIWVPIIIHFFNNGLQVVGLYIASDQIETMQSLSANDQIDFPWVSVLISIILCFFVVQLIRNVNQKNSII